MTQQQHRDRQLRLCCRTGGRNLFARVSPKIARVLWQDARDAVVRAPSGRDGTGWNLSSDPLPPFESGGDSGVEFLPLEITLQDGSKIYTSYNGGSIEDTGSIELPDNGLPDEFVGGMVSLVALPFISDVDHLAVEPVTTNDWELVELYSEFLENGSLLNQISVVYPGQILRLFVGGNNYVYLRVDPDLPDCYRLLADTEIIVVPKPRRKVSSPSPPLRLVGTFNDWSHAMTQLAAASDISLLKVSPGTMLIHPKTLATKIPGWIECESCPHATVWRANCETDSRVTVAIVRIEASEDIDEDCIALHVLNRYSINASPLVDCVQVSILLLDQVEMIRRRTAERLLYGDLKLEVQTLKIEEITDDDPWKPWRHADPCDYVQTTLNTPWLSGPHQNPEEMFLTKDSVFFSSVTNSLSRLCLADSQGVIRDRVNYYQAPPAIVTVVEAEQAHVTRSSLWEPSRNDKTITSMPVTRHCPRAFYSNWVEAFLEQRKSVDAWVIQGDSGTGKTHHTHILAAIARMKWGMPTWYLDCKQLQAGPDLRMKSTLDELTAVFRQAMESQPSVLILDDLDHLLTNHDDDGVTNGGVSHRQINPVAVDQSKLLANHVQSLMDCCVSEVIFVISCRAVKSLAAEVTESLPCYRCVELEQLSSDERSMLVDSMLNIGLPHVLDLLSSMTEGYRVKDLHVVITRINHVSNNSGYSEQVIKSILEEYVPLSRQGLNIEVGREHQEWCNIGGIFEVKNKLKAAILNPVKYRRIYERAPIQLPKGILLFGPPGCGKSYLVPALAKECGHTLITCRGPELLDRYIGASEANVRQLFERARSAAPSILFLDEFDALAPRRGSDNTGVTDRVVNQLLTYLDGVERMLEGVFLVAATSRPDKIDPALLRPGRLDQHIYVGYPESSAESTDILVKMMAQRQTATKLLESFLMNSFVLDDNESGRLAQLSPADIKAVLDTAHLEAIHEFLACPQRDAIQIDESHFRKGLLATRASVSLDDRAMLAQLYQPFITSSRASYAKETNSEKLLTSLK